jgi:trehalose 6-phosphate phosphatase
MKNRIELPRPLFDHLAEVASKVRAAGHVFLFLDFDGTLAPIVEESGAAAMPPETRELLVRLIKKRSISLAIVSGRSLADLQARVGLERLIYAGNHGLKICGPGLSFVEPAADRRTVELRKLTQDLGMRLSHISGANVENNGLTASVHFRQASKNDLEEIRRLVDLLVGSRGDLFHVTNGLMVFEIRPRVNWNKGIAVQWILTASERPDALPVYVGDDVTDEDAFSALPEGITVKVGRAAGTSAKYYLEYQDETPEFLSWLAGLDDGRRQLNELE